MKMLLLSLFALVSTMAFFPATADLRSSEVWSSIHECARANTTGPEIPEGDPYGREWSTGSWASDERKDAFDSYLDRYYGGDLDKYDEARSARFESFWKAHEECYERILSSENYELGGVTCDRFLEKKLDHEKEPESEFMEYRYARCLVIKGGATKKEELTDEGFRKLHHLVETKHHVLSAYFIARYHKSAGKFEGIPTEEVDFISAIEAYSYVLYLIDLDTDWPRGYELSEKYNQMELLSLWSIVDLYMFKFIRGSIGDTRRYWYVSPSYEGPKGRDSFPKYSPYTLDSLNQTIQKADNCLNSPKKRFFHPDLYKKVKQSCQIFKEGAEDLIPLEQERQRLLTQDSCRIDVIKCEEFQKVFGEIRTVWDKTSDDAFKILRSASYYKD